MTSDSNMKASNAPESNLLVNDRDKYKSMRTRVLSSVWMIGGFIFIIYLGHLYIWAMIVVIQLFMAQELFTLARVAQKARAALRDKDKHKQYPEFHFLNWHFFVTAMLYVYGRFLSKQLIKTISSDVVLSDLFSGIINYHMITCYFMYIAGFVWFIVTLKKGMYQYQFSQFAWTHMILFVVFAQSSFTVANIFEGMIWFLLPASLIVINDIAAYFFGFFFGRTPLIKLSPKKTWEGFIGASFATIISAFVLSYYLSQFQWLTCPRTDLSTGWLTCDPGPLFKPVTYNLSGWLSFWVRWKEVHILPVQWHSMAFGLFASIFAPFGGFFASGFKRAFKVKDFGASIPGHGGITDRMDCQMVMAVFSYTWYQSFIAPQRYSVEVFLDQILGSLKIEEQIRLYNKLGEALRDRAIRSASTPSRGWSHVTKAIRRTSTDRVYGVLGVYEGGVALLRTPAFHAKWSDWNVCAFHVPVKRLHEGEMAEAACSCAARVGGTVMELRAAGAALPGAAVEARVLCSRRGFFSGAALRVAAAEGGSGHARASGGVRAQQVAAVEVANEPAKTASRISSGKTLVAPTPTEFKSRYAPDEPRKGSDILVEALEREGVRNVFAYPGGASMEIHQALTRSKAIRNILCRHEQGEIFAAEGYAKASGRIGVCIATSGPGATNLVTGLADAMLDSVPLVAITGQVPRRMIGTDAFQETPIVEVTRSITKHNYLVMNVDDIPRVIREAFFLAASGRPGPVLVDIPKDVQQQMAIPYWDQPMNLRGYLNRLPPSPDKRQIEQILRLLQSSKKPVIYSGGGCLHASDELREFVELTGIPVASTLMGLGAFPESDDLSLQMLGMHGTVYANYAIDQADLLLAFGVRFDDRVTGKLEEFASRASIVHIDIDPAEIGKNKQPHVSVCGDVKLALGLLNGLIKQSEVQLSYSSWVKEIEEQKKKWPMKYPSFEDQIAPQFVIQTLHKLTGGQAIVSTGVGQHQMWAAQWFHFDQPRRWLTSGGLGAMGFGLPAALGAAATYPEIPVIDIDGDGSFVMNVQELATICVEKLPVKIVILNNQHLGMVVQWEDRFYKANRAHTYLGDPENEAQIYPDFCTIAKGFKVPSARVTRKEDLEDALKTMLSTPGPYLLDVIVPHQEHVLPMIPGGASFKDIITEGDGRTTY